MTKLKATAAEAFLFTRCQSQDKSRDYLPMARTSKKAFRRNNSVLLKGERPIERISDDALGRAAFAKALSRAICFWNGSQSLVMALYGRWGDGKSSVKGMVLNDLRRIVRRTPIIVEFNPWEWAGQGQIASAFFEEIGKQIGQGGGTKVAKEAESRFRTVGKVLTHGANFVERLGAIADIALPGVGVAAQATAAIARKAGDLADSTVELQKLEAEIASKSLPEIKKTLFSTFKKLTRPVLIVLDDIDRLSAEEIKLLFQLVKANSDFPNLVFFLLFQRDIVEDALEKTIKAGSGKDYLEKIVQIGFDLPQVPRHLLDRFLRQRINETLERCKVLEKFDWKRWDRHLDAFTPFFKNLRDIYRFLGTYEFHLGIFSGRAFDANPVDVFAVEVLRVFEPEAYSVLAKSRQALFGRLGHFSVEEFDPTNVRLMKARSAILASLSEQSKWRVLALLEFLFPNHFQGAENQWQRELRICDPDFFDRYFQLALTQKDIGQAEIDELIIALSSQEAFIKKISELETRSLLHLALQRLIAYEAEFRFSNALPVTIALFDTIESFTPGDLDNTRTARWIIDLHLKLGGSEQRFKILKKAMSVSTGLYLPTLHTDVESDRVAKARTGKLADNRFVTVSEPDLRSLQIICSTKIKEAALSGRLAHEIELPYLLDCWSKWDEGGDLEEYVQGLIRSEPILVLERCLRRVFATDTESEFLNSAFPPGLAEIPKIIDLNALHDALLSVDSSHIDSKQRQLLEFFKKGYSETRLNT